MSKHNIFFITDCTDDAARVDVETATRLAFDAADVTIGAYAFQGVGKFNTVELSYAAAHRAFVNDALRFQLGVVQNNDVLILNAAPPKSAKGADAHHNNERSNFVFGKLSNGALFAGTINGLSLLKPLVTELYDFEASNNGSQFRSRDVLPRIAAGWAAKGADFVEETASLALSINDIPDFPSQESRVVHIDAPFNNVKILFTKEDRAFLDKIAKGDGRINVFFGKAATPVDALITDRLFDADEGQKVVVRGSSSSIYTSADLKDKETLGQLITLQRHPDAKIGYELPIVGQSVRFTPR